MDAGDGALRLMPFQMGDQNQQWEREMQQGYIRSRLNHNRVLDIFSQSAAFSLYTVPKYYYYYYHYYMAAQNKRLRRNIFRLTSFFIS